MIHKRLYNREQIAKVFETFSKDNPFMARFLSFCNRLIVKALEHLTRNTP